MLIDFLAIFTPVAYATVDTFVRKVNTFIVNPLIVLLTFLAVAFFIYGIFEYIKGSDNADAKEKGKQHMIWGIIGLFIMVSVFFIIKVIMGTIGIDENEINVQTGEVNIQPAQD